jgi:hypothetical protein
VVNGKYVHAHLVGDVLLRSECGNFLVLQGVLYSPSINKNIISAPQLIKNQDYIIIMKDNYVELTAVQKYQSENAYEDIREFIYIYWKTTTGICVKIPATKNYRK